MKRVFILCLSLCMVSALALAAPANAGDSGVKIAVSNGGRMQAPGEELPLHPNKSLTLIMTPGTTWDRAYSFTIKPSKEAVGGDLVRQPELNLWLEQCPRDMYIIDIAPKELTCTIRLKNQHKEGQVEFKNQSRGVLMVGFNSRSSDASGGKKK